MRRLGLVGLIPVILALGTPTGPAAAMAQETGGREMSQEQSQALEAWARHLLRTLPAPEEQGNGPVGTETEIRRLWALYFLAVDHRSRVDDGRSLAEALASTELSGEETTTVQALAGALEVVRAKHSRWPPNKLNYLKTGLRMLDRLVEQHPGAPEVRYLRLVSCYFLPFFLEREGSVEEDFQALSGLLPLGPGSMPDPIYTAAVGFLLDNGEFQEETRARLRGLLE